MYSAYRAILQARKMRPCGLGYTPHPLCRWQARTHTAHSRLKGACLRHSSTLFLYWNVLPLDSLSLRRTSMWNKCIHGVIIATAVVQGMRSIPLSVALILNRIYRSSIGESLTYSPISSEDAPAPRSRSTSSHGFRSSALDLAQANTSHHQRQFQYSALDDGTAYSSLAFLPFGQFHNVALDPEQEIQAGVDFTYPSPIASIGVNILQEELSFKQGFFDYLGVESRTRGEGSKFIEKDIGHPIEAVN